MRNNPFNLSYIISENTNVLENTDVPYNIKSLQNNIYGKKLYFLIF